MGLLSYLKQTVSRESIALRILTGGPGVAL